MKKYFSIVIIFFTLLVSTITYAHHISSEIVFQTLHKLINDTEFENVGEMHWKNGNDSGRVGLHIGIINKQLGKPCRIFELEHNLDGLVYTAEGLLCLDESGSWELVSLIPDPKNPKFKPLDKSHYKEQYEANKNY